MKDYILKADKRRPLKFNGVFLGSSCDLTEETLREKLFNDVAPSSATVLDLYKTKSGKIVLHTKRYSTTFHDDEVYMSESSDLDVYGSFEDYVQEAKSQGRLTVTLVNKVTASYPELEEHWVETID